MYWYINIVLFWNCNVMGSVWLKTSATLYIVTSCLCQDLMKGGDNHMVVRMPTYERIIVQGQRNQNSHSSPLRSHIAILVFKKRIFRVVKWLIRLLNIKMTIYLRSVNILVASSCDYIFSSRRHRRWDGGSYGFYLRFFLASSFAYNFVRK